MSTLGSSIPTQKIVQVLVEATLEKCVDVVSVQYRSLLQPPDQSEGREEEPQLEITGLQEQARILRNS